MRRLILFLPLVLFLAGCGPTEDPTPIEEPAEVAADQQAPELTAVYLPGIARVHRAGPVYLGAQPSLDGFQRLTEQGVNRLINLRYDAETPGFDESNALSEAGFDYINTPWNGPGELSDDVFDQARSLLADVDAPTMMYCNSSNRVGAVWLPFRVLDQGVPLERALVEARLVGLRAPEYEQRAIEYIESRR